MFGVSETLSEGPERVESMVWDDLPTAPLVKNTKARRGVNVFVEEVSTSRFTQ